MGEISLLKETRQALEKHGKTPEQVEWIGTKDGRYTIFSWERFVAMAGHIVHDPEDWHREIADLVVVGESWWLERYVYDGSERWVMKQKPRLQPDPLPLTIARMRW
jgi:hypothetical protein